eukprot:TRINITY_DN62207_c0_g1_i1.p1 TRINITY_DN62207_c0_g1~~TRINITY_DN62207_c0_g1_i1.p1  ORF type:complete len:221 (-),score=67.06 TRINITY_DN62207_c0_g1_i1:37-699(-)
MEELLTAVPEDQRERMEGLLRQRRQLELRKMAPVYPHPQPNPHRSDEWSDAQDELTKKLVLASGEANDWRERSRQSQLALDAANTKLEAAQRMGWKAEAQAESCQNALNLKAIEWAEARSTYQAKVEACEAEVQSMKKLLQAETDRAEQSEAALGRLEAIVAEMSGRVDRSNHLQTVLAEAAGQIETKVGDCLLYTSDAADEEDSVEFAGRRIVKIKENT